MLVQAEAAPAVLLKTGLVDLQLVASGALGGIHGLIGAPQQGFCCTAIVGIDHQPDRGLRAVALQAFELHRFVQIAHQPVHELERVGTLDVGQQDHELVATEPGHAVDLAHRVA